MNDKKYILLVFVLIVPAFLGGCNKEQNNLGPKYSANPLTDSIPNYTIAVYPLHNPAKLLKTYQPLIDYLNNKINNAHFHLEASRDYGAFEEKYKNKKPDFLLPNPLQTLQAEDYGYTVIAMAGEAQDFIGLFLVKNNNVIKSAAGLKGKVISYPSKTAFAACLIPQFYLYKQGIDVKKDIKNIYVGSQESSIMNVYLGTADVGVTWSLPWKIFQKEHPREAARLKILWKTEPLINNSFMAKKEIPAELSEKVRRELIELKNTEEGKKILDNMEITRFIKAKNKDYEIVRNFILIFERSVRRIEE